VTGEVTAEVGVKGLQRIALGLSYQGQSYWGWQSQAGGNTVQDQLEKALSAFADEPLQVHCAGRTDSGVHGLMQVVHLDTSKHRESFSWVRGVNALLPRDIAVQWAQAVPADFHARGSALSRRYIYVVLESIARPALEHQRCGWVFRPLHEVAMQEAVQYLLGEHDFSAFRAAACQALSPIKTMKHIKIRKQGAYWVFEFEASAFLHHMIRNIMGTLIEIGQGQKPSVWMKELLEGRNRKWGAPTFPADGLYFLGPTYAPSWQLPDRTVGFDWLPGAASV
jgi:tRNA pseudouridine38-40 synthase